jgi:hypothetical protein
MTYELYKQLKDAGFPQILSEGFAIVTQGKNVDNNSVETSVYVPSLSKLISACMQLMKPKKSFPEAFDFFSLYPILNTRQSGDEKQLGDIEEWAAGWEHGLSLDDIEWRQNFFGKSPDEAVAKLWLELIKS